MPRLSTIDSILFGFANSSLVFTLIYAMTGLHDEFRLGFATEDGPVEWSTAAGLFLASMILFRNSARLLSKRGAVAAAITAFYGVVFFFGAGEEISWGHRLFNWEASEFFLQNNAQQETNLHNLVVGDVELVKTLFGSGLSIVILFYLLILPLLYTRIGAVKAIVDKIALPVADTRHMVLALVASIVMLVVPLKLKFEVYEFVFALTVLSIFIAPRNADVTT